jgi:DNA-binding IclR family transcriptional regulator
VQTEGLSSVQRAIAVLTALGSDGGERTGGLGVVEIARRVEKEKTQVSRTLKVLADAGLVERDPETLGYRLGWRLFTLATNAGEQRLIAAAPRVLRKLVAVVAERGHLSVLNAGQALTVVSENPLRSVQAAGWVGRTTPLYCTSSGRALLFDHTEDEVRELFEATKSADGGPRAPLSAKQCIERLNEAREAGYALADEEFESGLVAAAAPVRDFADRVVGAVNVSAPRFRAARSLPRIGKAVASAANQLTVVLGGEPRPVPAKAKKTR